MPCKLCRLSCKVRDLILDIASSLSLARAKRQRRGGGDWGEVHEGKEGRHAVPRCVRHCGIFWRPMKVTQIFYFKLSVELNCPHCSSASSPNFLATLFDSPPPHPSKSLFNLLIFCFGVSIFLFYSLIFCLLFSIREDIFLTERDEPVIFWISISVTWRLAVHIWYSKPAEG